ncbi:unnamed protein product [Lactuca virosa]|uniref:Uncharacterized protein n=1 Tax=Lactuca virosa TaxID=75947 RepID=A0AAU9M3V7_9ASTR|nr:unnamed protein product [Lactuca virosa]
MASSGSFSYDGFHTSDLDIPSDYELVVMEMQVEVETLRNHMNKELMAVREQLALMQKKFNFSLWILILKEFKTTRSVISLKKKQHTHITYLFLSSPPVTCTTHHIDAGFQDIDIQEAFARIHIP